MASPFPTITGEFLVVIIHYLYLLVVLLYILDLENKVSDWAISFFQAIPLQTKLCPWKRFSPFPITKI